MNFFSGLGNSLSSMIINALAAVLDAYNLSLQTQVQIALDAVRVILQDTPNLLQNHILNNVLNTIVDMALSLTVLGFILNLNATLVGLVGGGSYTIRRAIIKFVITLLLVSNSGAILLNVMDLNDAAIESFNDKTQNQYNAEILKDKLDITKAKDTMDSINIYLENIKDKMVKSTATLISLIVMIISASVLWVLGFWRIVQLSFMLMISPLAFMFNVLDATSNIPFGFFMKFIAITFRTFIYFIILAVFIGLSALSTEFANGSVVLYVVSCAILVYALYKLPKEVEQRLGLNNSSFNLSSIAIAVKTVVSAI